MFITSGLFPDILYVYISILASVITGVFLFASLMKTGRLRKAVYVSCGSILLIFILPVAVYSGFIDPVYALLAGMLVVSFLWGVFRYERLWRQNRALLLCILALMLTFVQIVVVWIPVFLPDILSFVFHYELEIPGGSTISLFYLSLSLGIPLLFASYLPRRSKQWKDDAAVLLSALAFAAAVCGILFSFQSWYRGLLIWGLDLILCLLTLAAYVLLLMAGKRPGSGQSEPLSDTETEQSSSD